MARPTLFTHRKFRRLAIILGAPRPHVLGHLEFLWHSTYESGEEVLGDSVDVEAAAEWQGEPGRLCRALLDVGFIDEVPGRPGVFVVHDLWDHCPDYVARRRQRESSRKNRYSPRPSRRKGAGDPELVGLIPANSDYCRKSSELVATPTPTPAPFPSPLTPSLKKGSASPSAASSTEEHGERKGEVGDRKTNPPTEDLKVQAREVVAHYERVVRPERCAPGGEQVVERLLQAGHSPAQLRDATVRYGALCDRENRQLKFRKGAASFFRNGWQEVPTAPTYTPPPRIHRAKPRSDEQHQPVSIMAILREQRQQKPQEASQAPGAAEGCLDGGSCQEGLESAVGAAG